MTHLMVCLTLPLIAFPELSWAGANRERLCKTRQVVESSDLDPLELATVQPVARPLLPIDSTTTTEPCSSFWIADSG